MINCSASAKIKYLGELNKGRHDQRILFLHTEIYDENGKLDIEDISLRTYICRDEKVLDALNEEAERRKYDSDFEKHKEVTSFSEDMYLQYVVKCAKERIVQDTSSTFTSLN